MKNFLLILVMSLALILLIAERHAPAFACAGVAYFLSLEND